MGVKRDQGVARRDAATLRILHVSDVYLPRLGGIELHVRDLAHAQRAAGHHVEVVTATPLRPGTVPVDDGITVHRPAGTSWAARTAHVLAMRDLGARGGFDVVHAHCSTFSPLAFLALGATLRSSRGVPTALTVHSLWRYYTPLYTGAGVALRWHRWPVAWSAVSSAAAEAVAGAAAGPLDVAVVPNGIDLSTWAVAPREPAADSVRFASVMRLAARKRPLPLLRMLREVRRQVPEHTHLSAVIIGDGPARDAMVRYRDRHGMDWVELPGQLPRDEVAARLAEADVYVAPARLESFGIAALEARAAGLPVVARRRTGIADFVVDGRDGRLCDSDDDMVAALTALALAPGHRRRRPHSVGVLERMAWPSLVAQCDALYATAAARAAGRGRPTRAPRWRGGRRDVSTARRAS